MATGRAYYRGGPRDGQLQLASTDGEYLEFPDGPPPWPRYKLTTDKIVRNGVEYPVVEYVGPGQTGPTADHGDE